MVKQNEHSGQNNAELSAAPSEATEPAMLLSPKQQISPLEKLFFGIFTFAYATLIGSIFHISKWQFCLHFLLLCIVVWREWNLLDEAKENETLAAENTVSDEIIRYGIGGLIVFCAWVSHIFGWWFFLYFFPDRSIFCFRISVASIYKKYFLKEVLKSISHIGNTR